MPSVTLYEAAFDKHLQSQSYAYWTELSGSLSPTVALDGVDGPLAWPWTSTQEQQLTALNTSMVPADRITIFDMKSWETYLEWDILPDLQESLYVTSDVRAVLSHLCIDSAETTLAPTPEIPHVVGTLVVSLPSTYEGGELTFTNGTDTQVLTASREGVQLFASFNKITSAPITSGRRVALVYALTCDAQSWVPPVTRDDVIEAFATIAQDPPDDAWHIARAMDADSVSFSFEGLGRVDKALVGVLAATGGYDVTLVGFKTYRDVYDSDDADEYDWTSDAALYENEIIRIPFRESGSALDVVVPGLLDQSAHHFLGRKRVDDDYGLKCPMAAILFWPKRFRVTIARPSGVVSLLKAAIEDGKLDDLGLGLHDFVLGALTTFDDNTSTALDADAMGRLLLQYKDVELVKRFLRDTLPLSISDKTNTARCIYESLDTFGWPTLLPSIQSLLARAAKDFGGFSAICPLLASLAGLPSERDAVCPPLRQPYTGEFLKACWQAAVLEPAFRPGAHPTQYSILLDWYFDAVLPARPNDNYLGKWLPAPLLLLVDSFAYTRVVGSHSALSAALPPWDQLRYLPRALLAATQCQPSLPRAPYITAVTTAMSLKAMRGSLSAHETATLLQYLDVVGCVDANLVAMCPALSGGIGNFLWGVLEFVKRAPPPAATAALMMRFLLDLAPTVPCTRRDYSGNNVPMIDALADLISALAMLSPEAALQCAAAWRSGLPPTLDAVRDILYPLVEKLQRQESDVRFRELLAYLATECRATLVDGGALAPLPAFKDYAIADAIDMDATHCDQCVAFVRFLCTGNATAMIYCNSDCSKIKAVVARHPHRLILTRQDNGYSSYLELRKQTWPGMASADDAAAHLRREDERRQDEQRVKKLTALLADLAPKVSGSKRRMEDA